MPIDALESSTLEARPALRNFWAVFRKLLVSNFFSCTKRWRGRTDLFDESTELGVAAERNDEDLDGGDGRREGEDTAVHVVLARPVRVLEKGVEDATDTKRGLDDVRSELAY